MKWKVFYRRWYLFGESRGEGYRYKKVSRASGRNMRLFLFVVLISLVKEKAGPSVESQVVRRSFRRQMLASNTIAAAQKGRFDCRNPNDLQTELTTHWSLSYQKSVVPTCKYKWRKMSGNHLSFP